MMTFVSSQKIPWREMVLRIGTSAISAKISGNADKRKDILDPQNWRYNRGKHRVLNYSMWSARGQGQTIRTSWLGRRAWWMMTHSPTVPKGGWL